MLPVLFLFVFFPSINNSNILQALLSQKPTWKHVKQPDLWVFPGFRELTLNGTHILLNGTLFLKPTIHHNTSTAENSNRKPILTFQLQFDEVSVPQILKKHPIWGWCFEVERDVCTGFPLESGEVEVRWWSDERSRIPVIPCRGETGKTCFSALLKLLEKLKILRSIYATVLSVLKKELQVPWFLLPPFCFSGHDVSGFRRQSTLMVNLFSSS